MDEYLKCTRCNKLIECYGDVGYDGPVDRDSQDCNPFMSWETVCRECEEKNEQS